MANLKIFANLENKSINFEDDFSLNPNDLEILISVPKQGDYNNLSFEFTLNSDGIVIKNQSFPAKNEKYICNNQEFIDRSLVIGIIEDINYDIDFWCEESGERFEGSHSFSVSLPKNI